MGRFYSTPCAVITWLVVVFLLLTFLWGEYVNWHIRYVLCLSDDDFVNFPAIFFNFPLNCSLTNHYNHTSEYPYHMATNGSEWDKKVTLVVGNTGGYVVIYEYHEGV